jgi:hypothetical protein
MGWVAVGGMGSIVECEKMRRTKCRGEVVRLEARRGIVRLARKIDSLKRSGVLSVFRHWMLSARRRPLETATKAAAAVVQSCSVAAAVQAIQLSLLSSKLLSCYCRCCRSSYSVTSAIELACARLYGALLRGQKLCHRQLSRCCCRSSGCSSCCSHRV